MLHVHDHEVTHVCQYPISIKINMVDCKMIDSNNDYYSEYPGIINTIKHHACTWYTADYNWILTYIIAINNYCQYCC